MPIADSGRGTSLAEAVVLCGPSHRGPLVGASRPDRRFGCASTRYSVSAEACGITPSPYTITVPPNPRLARPSTS